MKHILNEFKKFAVKGNMIDMAVGIMIGTAFNRVVSSLVENILMPPLGILMGGINFADYKMILSPAVLDETGKQVKSPVMLDYGQFLQTIFNFVIIAFSMFLIVKGINTLRDRFTKKEKEETPLFEPPHEIKLLTEIRDILAHRK